MLRQYRYVGPHDLRALLREPAHRHNVQQKHDVLIWIRQTNQRKPAEYTVVATYIIDTAEELWIADQRSEHVVCARGQEVLAAGEISFTINKTDITVTEISNQSTGYCPEPTAWLTVAKVLDRIGLVHPQEWTSSYVFRLCRACDTINIVKDQWFECAVCNTPLDAMWNFD